MKHNIKIKISEAIEKWKKTKPTIPEDYLRYNIQFDKAFFECRVPDIWRCITSTQYTHELYRLMCYKDKRLIEYQDIDDCLSSQGEKEWLLYLEKACLDKKIQRQKFIPFENTYNKETKET